MSVLILSAPSAYFYDLIGRIFHPNWTDSLFSVIRIMDSAQIVYGLIVNEAITISDGFKPAS